MVQTQLRSKKNAFVWNRENKTGDALFIQALEGDIYRWLGRSRVTGMKQILLMIAVVMLVGCGESKSKRWWW